MTETDLIADKSVDRVLTHYLIAALWADAPTDEDGMPLGDFDITDITEESREEARKTVADFLLANAADLTGIDEEQIGHDLWLTRNGHGAGFWDRGLGEIGERLTVAAQVYGEAHLWMDRDNTVQIEG